jgi:hypothetical protein
MNRNILGQIVEDFTIRFIPRILWEVAMHNTRIGGVNGLAEHISCVRTNNLRECMQSLNKVLDIIDVYGAGLKIGSIYYTPHQRSCQSE